MDVQSLKLSITTVTGGFDDNSRFELVVELFSTSSSSSVAVVVDIKLDELEGFAVI